MNGMRGLIPATVAVGVGIFTGYYTFKPSFQQLQAERKAKEQQGSLPEPTEDENVSSQNAQLSPLIPTMLAESREPSAPSPNEDNSSIQWLWGFGKSPGKSSASRREDSNPVQNKPKGSHEGAKKDNEGKD